jgi:hypothetical protein
MADIPYSMNGFSDGLENSLKPVNLAGIPDLATRFTTKIHQNVDLAMPSRILRMRQLARL